MNNFQNITKIKGDASLRKFFRRKNKKSTSIIVYAKKEKQKNLLIYDAINKVLNRNKILAPKLYKENYNNGYLEIEDFGNHTVYKVFKDKNKNKISYFIKIIKVLNQIQSIKNRSIKNFKNKKYTIPIYENKILINEANLFTKWYVKKKLSKIKKVKFENRFKKIIKKLTLNLKLKNNVFVHRDFHVSNLMLMDKKIAVIDSQDALIGNRAYDLASLIDDVRIKTSISLKNKVYNAYTKRQKKLDKKNFKNDFEILSILRNLKIIGIFTRLAIRDRKKNYLKLIPYAWTLINTRINKNKIFQELKILLNENFKKKLNEN